MGLTDRGLEIDGLLRNPPAGGLAVEPLFA